MDHTNANPTRCWKEVCWAHARRKLYEVHVATSSPIAHEVLERIGALYHVEEQLRGRTPDQRRAIRQARFGPPLNDLHRFLVDLARLLPKKSELTGATL